MSAELETFRALTRALVRYFGDLEALGSGGPREDAAARVFSAIGRQGTPVRQLREQLGLDSGYLSRLLRMLERRGLIQTEARRGEDARYRFVRRTRAGHAHARRLEARAQSRVQALLGALPRHEARRTVAAATQLERLVRRSSLVIEPEDPSSRSAKWCFARYFDELDERFPGGFDRYAGGGTVRSELLPPRGRLLIARLEGVPVGCGAIRAAGAGVAEIKRMWVAPSARGHGVGRALLEALERVARRQRVRAIRLDTHASLAEALRLYRKAGYRRIARYNDNPYAQRWFEKQLHQRRRQAG